MTQNLIFEGSKSEFKMEGGEGNLHLIPVLFSLSSSQKNY